jgi:hypothetical protein
MHSGFPVLDFPAFGLDSDWDGPRWLWSLEGNIGDPVWGVWLAHSYGKLPEASDPRMLVGTLPAQRHGELMARSHDPAEAIAFSVLLRLLDMVTPDLGDEDRTLEKRSSRRLLDDEPEHYPQWPEVTWLVNGRPVSARVFEWGGGWAGFTPDIPDVVIAVVARSMPLTGVNLVDIGRGSAYHFDTSAELIYPDVLESARRVALGEETDWTRGSWPLHADQLALLAADPEPVPEPERAPLVEDPQTLEELATYIDHHHACTGGGAEGDDDTGPVQFSCDCGKISGWYASHEEGEAALDEHLDAVGVGHERYVKAWLEQHRPTSGHIQGRGWGLHVHGPDNDNTEDR